MIDFMPATLEEIAERGVRFENAFVSTASCAPSRATIYSGRYAHNHGILDNSGLLAGGHHFDHENNLAGWLRQAGYRTGIFGEYMPWAEVLVDGRVLGETPLANLQLPIGVHQLVFRHPDLGERAQTVTVRLDGPNRVTADLRR